MAPSDYARSRDIVSKPAGDESSPLATTTTLVDGRPYLPNLVVDTSDEASVVASALSIVLLSIRIAASNGATDVGRGGSRAAAAESLELNDCPIDATSRHFSKMSSQLSCVKVTGGITNALFRVTGFGTLGPSIATELFPIASTADHDDGDRPSRDVVASLVDFDSVLVRIFGAEGMIDRDLETSTYSALCDAGVAYRYLGRFGNGRVEGWLDGYSPLACSDLADVDASLAIAREMARLHYTFVLPGGELEDRHRGVGLWDQLGGWMDQARGYAEFKTPEDTERVRGLGLDEIEVEVRNFIDSFAASSPPSNDEGNDGDGGKGGGGSDKGKERIVFSHNDLLAANIMRHQDSGKIQLIDFEYGGTNYAAFDIANHLNEHAGGTSAEENGIPDYSRFPDPERQMSFCLEYVRTSRELTGADVVNDEGLRAEANDLLDQVQKFLLVNHLYWGLWAVNQAAEEGCDEFDYINFATSRFKEFRAMKAAREGA